jgi:hypothetical protein
MAKRPGDVAEGPNSANRRAPRDVRFSPRKPTSARRHRMSQKVIRVAGTRRDAPAHVCSPPPIAAMMLRHSRTTRCANKRHIVKA